MQAVWHVLLDDDFISAYKTGITVTCPDGVTRGMFPWVMTYSADYPEKYACVLSRSDTHRHTPGFSLLDCVTWAPVHVHDALCINKTL